MSTMHVHVKVSGRGGFTSYHLRNKMNFKRVFISRGSVLSGVVFRVFCSGVCPGTTWWVVRKVFVWGWGLDLTDFYWGGGACFRSFCTGVGVEIWVCPSCLIARRGRDLSWSFCPVRRGARSKNVYHER